MKEMDGNLGIITLVCGEVEGQKFWAYVDILPSQYMKFLDVQKAGDPYTLTDFGSVLKYGVDTYEPPEDTIEEMKREYGIDPDFQKKLKHDVERQVAHMQHKI
jgi:hypothetical protein